MVLCNLQTTNALLMRPTNEIKLIEKAKKGDNEALSQLYNDNIQQLYRFIFFKVGNKEDAEDLTQEVFLAAFRGLGDFRLESSFRNWCYQIAKVKIAEMWRKRYAMPTVDIEAVLGLDTATEIEIEEVAVEALSVDDSRVRQVERILVKLNEQQRKVLEYRFLKNYSIKETAAAMGISEANAKILQHRALKAAAIIGNGM